ncbi:hypothetical protein ATANTOWER_025882 [Ataeniobius toweri]|uniref:Uncharacterized protein n=1 Tax=Ataeniobius toweri TaxID=208326 RepID=A0ABU7AI64_9TELE|nr:hypothetical protein [Ataeniobius toweri]
MRPPILEPSQFLRQEASSSWKIHKSCFGITGKSYFWTFTSHSLGGEGNQTRIRAGCLHVDEAGFMDSFSPGFQNNLNEDSSEKMSSAVHPFMSCRIPVCP